MVFFTDFRNDSNPANHSIADYFPVSRLDTRGSAPSKSERIRQEQRVGTIVQRTENECTPVAFSANDSVDDKVIWLIDLSCSLAEPQCMKMTLQTLSVAYP